MEMDWQQVSLIRRAGNRVSDRRNRRDVVSAPTEDPSVLEGIICGVYMRAAFFKGDDDWRPDYARAVGIRSARSGCAVPPIGGISSGVSVNDLLRAEAGC